jgi:small conductance mechanosensitive channel
VEGSTQELVDTLVTLVSTWGLQVLGAVAVLVIGRIAAGMVRRGVTRSLERARTDSTLVPFFASMAYYLVLSVVLIAVLSLFGIQTTSLIAVLGAAGLAVGLALQGTLSNFAAGVMLLIFRPFRAGDYVEAAGTAGSVVEVGLFNCTLNTPDNVRIVVPNAEIYGGIIKNYAANDTRRNDLVLGISYGDDIGRAIDIARRVLADDARVLKEPEAVVAVGNLGDSSVDIVVRPWCRKEDYWPLRFDLQRRLKEEIEAAGCTIPFPQRDVHLFTNGASQGTA